MNFINFLWKNHKFTFFVLAAMFLVPLGICLSLSWKIALGFIAFCALTAVVCKFLFFVSDCYEDYCCERWNKGHFWER